MRDFFAVGFFVVLIGCTLLALRMWYASRGREVPPAERRVFMRFVAGIAVFWLVAAVGYFGGFLSLLR